MWLRSELSSSDSSMQLPTENAGTGGGDISSDMEVLE